MKIVNWNKLTESEKKVALLRPILSLENNLVFKTQEILNQAKLKGDEALFNFTKKFDGVVLNSLQVTDNEFEAALNEINPEDLEAIKFTKKQIETNQLAQIPAIKIIKTHDNQVICEIRPRPIDRVGLYIPGGSAPLVSTVLMLAIPAAIANCPLKIICTPPNAAGKINSAILVAAKLCGIEKVYKVGGAQAIAAMAYGTKSIPKVDKIFGPGNAWVTEAKKQIAQDAMISTSIDMPAGPSELLMIADDNANPDYVAADLLSQAEHGIDSQVILIALSESFALRVIEKINAQIEKLSRKNIAIESLKNGRIIISKTILEAISISNIYAPEHLILQIDNPNQYADQIQNSGAVFLGEFAPETVGDYVTGSNHVLPTSGYAKSYSGLSIKDFMKFINFQTVTRSGLKIIGPYAEKLASMEGLDAHQYAVSVRLNNI